MFFTLYFTKRERYCKAVRYLMARRDKYNLISRGTEGDTSPCVWHVYFARRAKR